ncbi:Os01g0518850, partial [Oryza sativa Japonica Group]
ALGDTGGKRPLCARAPRLHPLASLMPAPATAVPVAASPSFFISPSSSSLFSPSLLFSRSRASGAKNYSPLGGGLLISGMQRELRRDGWIGLAVFSSGRIWGVAGHPAPAACLTASGAGPPIPGWWRRCGVGRQWWCEGDGQTWLL